VVLIEISSPGKPLSTIATFEGLITRMDNLVPFLLNKFRKAFVAISAFEVLDAIVAIQVARQVVLFNEGLAALMAYKRFLARVAAIVTSEMVLFIGRVITLIASILLLFDVCIDTSSIVLDTNGNAIRFIFDDDIEINSRRQRRGRECWIL